MSDEAKNEARIFRVRTPFQAAAQQPGGVSRELAIENANRQVEKIKPELVVWMQDQLAELPVALAAAESSPQDLEKLNAVETIGRGLRDVGTTLGYGLLTFVAGNIAEIFEATRSGAPYRKDIVNCHLAALMLSIRDDYRQMDPDLFPELKLGLRQVLAIAHRAARSAP